jgi:hypothetical protein
LSIHVLEAGFTTNCNFQELYTIINLLKDCGIQQVYPLCTEEFEEPILHVGTYLHQSDLEHLVAEAKPILIKDFLNLDSKSNTRDIVNSFPQYNILNNESEFYRYDKSIRLMYPNHLMPFGINQGCTIEEIYKLTPQYLGWLMTDTNLCFNIKSFSFLPEPTPFFQDEIIRAKFRRIYNKDYLEPINEIKYAVNSVPYAKAAIELLKITPKPYSYYALKCSETEKALIEAGLKERVSSFSAKFSFSAKEIESNRNKLSNWYYTRKIDHTPGEKDDSWIIKDMAKNGEDGLYDYNGFDYWNLD